MKPFFIRLGKYKIKVFDSDKSPNVPTKISKEKYLVECLLLDE